MYPASKRLRLLDGPIPSASAPASRRALLADLHRACKQACVPWPGCAQWAALLRPPSNRSCAEYQAINRLELDIRHAISMADLAVLQRAAEADFAASLDGPNAASPASPRASQARSSAGLVAHGRPEE